MKVKYFPPGERYAKSATMTYQEAALIPIDRLATIQTVSGDRVAPTGSEELLSLLLSTQIVYQTGNIEPQIRRDGKIVAQITKTDVAKLTKLKGITQGELYNILGI